jgi:asparagine N-glycosylation enzyme membrane subunit Stt3
MLTMSDDIIEKRNEKLKELLSHQTIIIAVLLLVLLLLAWHIRTANVPGLKDVTTGDYTLGPDLDPFLFLRYAKDIVATGSIPVIDTMRVVPLGFNTLQETQLLPYLIAYFHKFLNLFTTTSVNYSAVIFPAFMFLLTIVAFFFLVGKIFYEHKYRLWISALASLFLMVIPSFLSRTIAGIPEKESAGFFFMFLAFYFILCFFRSSNTRNTIIFGILAGLSTAAMGLIWGGVIYVFTVMGVFGVFLWILGKIDKKEIIGYGIWLFVSFSLLAGLSGRYSFQGLATSPSSGISLAVFALIFVDYLLFNTRIKDISLVSRIGEKYPKKVVSIAVFIILGIVASSIVFGIGFIPSFISDVMFHLTQPYSDRFSFTVAENRQPFFGEWSSEFGPMLYGFPVFFWMFFLGSILLFYRTLGLHKRDKVYMIIVYSYFLVSQVFSRYAQNSVMNGTNFISKLIYFSGIAIFALYFMYITYIYEKRNEGHLLKEFNLSYIFIFAFFFVSIIGARSAIRLIMVLVPPASIIAAFVPFEILSRYSIDKARKTLWLVALIAVTLLTIFTVYNFYQTTYASAQNYVPGVYNIQWQYAMNWTRANTPTNAVFSHWWDYGYWLQSIGERATMLDGGNIIVYWDYLFGRHVLTGQSEQEALELLYTHNVSYLLIDSTDIGKYPAYSSIGSDENYDRYSWMTTFLINDKETKELMNGTEYYYQGGFLLDEDFMYKTNSSETLYPGRKAYIPWIKLDFSSDKSITGAEALLYYNGKQQFIPLNCVYFEGKTYNFNTTGYDGCFYMMPAVMSETQLDKKGAGILISPRVMKTEFAKLYLFGQGENFKLVHSEDDEVVKMLRAQGFNATDFVFYNGVRGPIKIWKVEYPQGMKSNPDYLATAFPSQDIAIAKPGYY